jgi:hypothetical protein
MFYRKVAEKVIPNEAQRSEESNPARPAKGRLRFLSNKLKAQNHTLKPKIFAFCSVTLHFTF